MADQQTIKLKSLANLCDITERRVQQLAKEDIMLPASKRGEYLFPASVINYVKFLHGVGAGGSGVLDYNQHRARKMKLEADKLQAQQQLQSQEMLSREEYEGLVVEAITIQKRELKALSLTLQRLVPGMNTKTIEQVERALARCHNAVLDLNLEPEQQEQFAND